MASKAACANLISRLGSLNFVYRQLKKAHPEWRASLALLSIIKRFGDIRVSDLAAFTNVGQSTISRQVDYLVTNGLVERFAQQNDGRSSVLRLTEEGARELDVALGSFASDLKAHLPGWSDADVKQLTELLARLENSLVEAQNNKTPN